MRTDRVEPIFVLMEPDAKPELCVKSVAQFRDWLDRVWSGGGIRASVDVLLPDEFDWMPMQFEFGEVPTGSMVIATARGKAIYSSDGEMLRAVHQTAPQE